MAKSFELHKATVRAVLAVRREPYWKRLAAGCYVGMRRTEKGAHYVARFRTATGVQKFRALPECTEYDQAEAAARAWFVDCGRGVTQVVTVEKACRDYVESLRLERGEQPAHVVEGYMRRRIYGTEFGARPIDRITASEVKAWRNALLTLNGGTYTKASANRDLKALKAGLNHAFKMEQCTRDEAWRAVDGFQNAENARDVFLTIEQRRKLIAHSGGAIRDLIEGCLHLAARPIELKRARVSDLNLERAHIALHSFKGKGSAKRERQVPLTPAALELFARLAQGKPADAFLFVDDDGREHGHSEYAKLFRKVCKAAGLGADVVLYSIRHTMIAQWLITGIDAQTVSKMAGTGLAMIERHYSKYIKAHAAIRLQAVPVV